MKLSEIKGEQALDVFADMLEPAAEIIADPEFQKYARAGLGMKAVKAAIKRKKRAVICLLAAIDQVDPDEYEVSVFSLPAKLMEIINDPAVQVLFQSQGQKTGETASGSATENTGGGET